MTTTPTSEPVEIKQYLPFVPKRVMEAVRDADGDVMRAAETLKVSAKRLAEDIAMSKKLRKYFIKLRKRQNQAEVTEYRNLSLKTILDNIEYKRALYRGEALEAIRDLATMEVSQNSAMMQVKLMAAVRLYNETGDKGAGDTINDTLQLLNNEFHSIKGRISSVRETTREVTFEESPRSIEADSSTYESTARVSHD